MTIEINRGAVLTMRERRKRQQKGEKVRVFHRVKYIGDMPIIESRMRLSILPFKWGDVS